MTLQLQATILWVSLTLIGLFGIFGVRNMYFPNHKYNRIEASLYAGLHRPMFALMVAWIIFASVHGYAGKSFTYNSVSRRAEQDQYQ